MGGSDARDPRPRVHGSGGHESAVNGRTLNGWSLGARSDFSFGSWTSRSKREY